MDTVSSAPSGARPAARRVTNEYSALARLVRETGLLRRRYGYYWTRLVVAVLAFGGIWVAVALVGNSWWQLVLAAAMAVVVTQIAFLGHDSAHRQIFRSRAWNDWTARVLAGGFVGLSYGWWRTKHEQHHSAPNQEGEDPDISPGVIAFTPAAVAARTGWRSWFARHQGWFFFPLLTLEGLNLHVASVRTVLRRGSVPHRGVEAPLVLGRLAVYVGVLVVLLPPGKAAAFLGVQLAVFGVMLGGSFAPNHKGMPIVPPDVTLDFLRRQVLMSRNVRGGYAVDAVMGGLNYQIEHHLFPSMPRPNLKKVRPIVHSYCEDVGVPYTEVGFFRSYGIVVRYLNRVGLRAQEPFTCPLAASLGR